MIVLANTLSALALVLGGLLNLYFWIVIIAAVLTWVRPDPYNPHCAGTARATGRSFTGAQAKLPLLHGRHGFSRWWCCWPIDCSTHGGCLTGERHDPAIYLRVQNHGFTRGDILLLGTCAGRSYGSARTGTTKKYAATDPELKSFGRSYSTKSRWKNWSTRLFAHLEQTLKQLKKQKLEVKTQLWPSLTV